MRGTLYALFLIQFCELGRFLDLGPCLAAAGAVIRGIAFASVCGAAVLFMLVFLRALLREARPRARFTEIRFPESRETISAAPISVEPTSRRLDKAA